MNTIIKRLNKYARNKRIKDRMKVSPSSSMNLLFLVLIETKLSYILKNIHIYSFVLETGHAGTADSIIWNDRCRINYQEKHILVLKRGTAKSANFLVTYFSSG